MSDNDKNHDIEETERFAEYCLAVLATRHMEHSLDYTIQSKRVFRLSWLCGGCEKVHIDRGNMMVITSLLATLMQLGVVSFEVQDEAYALHSDAVEAEDSANVRDGVGMAEFLRGFKK